MQARLKERIKTVLQALALTAHLIQSQSSSPGGPSRSLSLQSPQTNDNLGTSFKQEGISLNIIKMSLF